MHGAIFMQLKDFVVTHHGLSAWEKMLEMAGQPKMTMHLPTQSYPDTDAVALIKAACELTGQAPEVVLESFGIHIAPALLQMYRGLVHPDWKTLDLLMNVEDTIHKVVRHQNKGAEPPELHFKRINANTLEFLYESKRKMAPLAIGIIKGVAQYYKEDINVAVTHSSSESTTMLVTLADAAA